MTGARGRPVIVVDPAMAAVGTTDDLREALRRRGTRNRVDWIDTSEPLDSEDATGPSAFERGRVAAARAVSQGAPTVVACGDDTTVRACLEAVAGTSTALGVVSLGGGTLLASNLSIDAGPDAVTEALDGPVRRIDVGETNGEVFAVLAGFGTAALMGHGDHEQPRGVAEVLATVRSLRHAISRVTVHVDGVQRFDGHTVALLVANCPGGPGRSLLVPDADPADGALDLVVVAPRHPGEWVEVVWCLLAGRPLRSRLVRRHRGEWVYVQVRRPRGYELDGDPRPPAKRLDVQVWPDALAVRAPQEPVREPAPPVDEHDEHDEHGEHEEHEDRPPPPAEPTVPTAPTVPTPSNGRGTSPSARSRQPAAATEEADASSN